MEILRSLLKERRIEAYEAGGELAPAQMFSVKRNVFCQKICSRIIQSQFCIVMLNNEPTPNGNNANANVYMEYGLMIGFNKYIIPFQNEKYQLEFNVSGLDTIKYSDISFKVKASTAIDQAIKETARLEKGATPFSEDICAYLLLRGGLVAAIDNPGDKAVFELGRTCGFNLCVDFTGNQYIYFGNFPLLEPRVIIWRVQKLLQIIDSRVDGASIRAGKGYIPKQQMDAILDMRNSLQIWLLTKDSVDRDIVVGALNNCSIIPYVFTISDVSAEVGKSEMY